jgi:hypothetical protein
MWCELDRITLKQTMWATDILAFVIADSPRVATGFSHWIRFKGESRLNRRKSLGQSVQDRVGKKNWLSWGGNPLLPVSLGIYH